MGTFDKTSLSGETGRYFERTFTPFIEKVIQTHELPGLAVGVIASNQVVYARGFGVKSIKTQEPITPETFFHMASISKPFVATSIMQLVERGFVQLEVPIITYLPYFKLDDEGYRDITVQQMLSHVSGMPDEEDYEWENPRYDEGALERYVRSLSAKKLLSKPGEKFAYSNIAFECLGDVIAKVSGMSFDDYVKEHILNPAGMTESSFLKPKYLPVNWAAPHLRLLDILAWEGYPYNRMHGPSSTLHSNVLEMCNWAITNLNRGNFKGNQILSPESYEVLWKPWVDTGDGRQVGLSWFISEYRGEKMIQHGGGDTGFRSHLAMLPDQGAAAVVLCNLLPAPVEGIAHAALDISLGFEPTPVIPYASLPVWKTLREAGLEAAVAQWVSFKINHPDEYDFDPRQFYNLNYAIYLNQAKVAERLTRLCVRILPQPELNHIEGFISQFQNQAAGAALRVIREYKKHPPQPNPIG